MLLVVTVVGCVFAATTRASAQEPFYKDKPIRIIVGLAAGGGFDTYARVIARHLVKHIPGKATVVVENMTGAGSSAAKPDGLSSLKLPLAGEVIAKCREMLTE